MADIRPEIRWGTITGKFTGALADTTDAGTTPDAAPLTGTVTLTPSVPVVRFPSLTPPETVIVSSVVAKVIDGLLCSPDAATSASPGVRVIASAQPDGEPETVQWTASFRFDNMTGGTLPNVRFEVPDGGIIDISTVAPTTPPTGVQNVYVTAAATLVDVQAALEDESSSARTAIRSAVDQDVPAAVADVIADDPTVVDAAATAAAALAQSDEGLIRGDVVAEVPDWGDAVFSLAFAEDDRASFLDVRADGAPTNFATAMIGARLAELGHIPDPAEAQLSTTLAAHPTLSKPLTAPLIAFDAQPAASILAPRFVRSKTGSLHLFWSTDHDLGDGGIYRADALTANPLDGFTNPRLIFRDLTTPGQQTETPSIWYDPAEDIYRMTYQMLVNGATVNGFDLNNSQVTLMATSPDLTTWTPIGPIGGYVGPGVVGENHSGYWEHFEWAGSHYAYSLGGGGSEGGTYLWTSAKGDLEWVRHPQFVGDLDAWIDHMDGYVPGDWRMGSSTQAFEWRGRPWRIASMGIATSGFEEVPPRRVVAYPVRPDFLAPAGRAIDITPPSQAWEVEGISGTGNVVEYAGKLYVAYLNARPAPDDKKKSIGIMEVH